MKKQSIVVLLLAALLWQSCGAPKLATIARPTFDKHYLNEKMVKVDEEIAPKTIKFEKLDEQQDTLRYEESVNKWFKLNNIKLNAAVLHEGFEMKPLKTQGVSIAWAGDYKKYVTKDKTYHLSHVIEQGAFVLFFYGKAPNEFKVVEDVTLLVVRDRLSQKEKYIFDFKEFAYSPKYTETVKQFVFQDVLWAFIDNSTLYVSNAHWTYSNTTEGMNGYLTAIDLKTKKILWRAAPKVINAINFVMQKDYILAVYGFTREGAKLHAIDRKTGKTLGVIQLADIRTGKKHIEYLFKRANLVFVKAFDGTEYKIKVSD